MKISVRIIGSVLLENPNFYERRITKYVSHAAFWAKFVDASPIWLSSSCRIYFNYKSYNYYEARMNRVRNYQGQLDLFIAYCRSYYFLSESLRKYWGWESCEGTSFISDIQTLLIYYYSWFMVVFMRGGGELRGFKSEWLWKRGLYSLSILFAFISSSLSISIIYKLFFLRGCGSSDNYEIYSIFCGAYELGFIRSYDLLFIED